MTISRKERDRLQREEDVLNAAERIFSERGYFETSMEDVAREAEYATGTLYRYFESKEALYHELLLRKGRAYFSDMESLFREQASPAEQVKALIRGKVQFFFANRAFFNLFVQQIAGLSPNTACSVLLQELQDLRQAHFDRVRGILKQGMAQGVFRSMDPDLALSALVGVTDEILQASLRPGQDRPAEILEAFILDFFNLGIRSPEQREEVDDA